MHKACKTNSDLIANVQAAFKQELMNVTENNAASSTIKQGLLCS